ncbi:MAG: SRPBCC family protein [Anaerolineae bacterium]|nr:SRPBCC family protein [Anaerolineae bacterium]
MPHVEKSIVINLPPETVFQFIANQPERMPEWWGPMKEQKRITPAPTVLGSKSSYVYELMKFRVKGEHEVKAITPNRHMRIEVLTGIDCTFDFKFEPVGASATRLTVNVDYTTPGGILGEVANKLIIEKKNEEAWEEGLATLKHLLESGS